MNCNQLKKILGVLAIPGSKLTLKKVAATLSDITNIEVLADDLDELDEAGLLNIHRTEKFQSSEEKYNRKFVVQTKHMTPPDSRFKDYLAWVEYDDLCEYVASISVSNDLSINDKERLELLQKSDTYNRLVNAVLTAPVEEFRSQGKSLTALKDHLKEIGIINDDREHQVFGAVIREVYDFGRKPKGH